MSQSIAVNFLARIFEEFCWNIHSWKIGNCWTCKSFCISLNSCFFHQYCMKFVVELSTFCGYIHIVTESSEDSFFLVSMHNPKVWKVCTFFVPRVGFSNIWLMLWALWHLTEKLHTLFPHIVKNTEGFFFLFLHGTNVASHFRSVMVFCKIGIPASTISAVK